MTKDTQYAHSLQEIKQHIVRARQVAGLSVNAHMLYLDWEIGQYVFKKQTALGWSAKVIEQLSEDLRSSFPGMKGFSVRNLKYMVKFITQYHPSSIVQALPAQFSNSITA